VRGFEYVQCNAEKLPFPDASFDLVTIAFGLRNVTDKDAALREMLRVLRWAGRRGCWSSPKSPPTGSSRSTTSTRSRCCRSWASCSPATPTATSTWPKSIRKHPPQEQLKAMMEAAGFARCEPHRLHATSAMRHRGHRAHRLQGLST
jgi:demethylmenaquinone methyltransferase/2-methoxy-6-polyprenyl-1,4-benzoquinol methylase